MTPSHHLKVVSETVTENQLLCSCGQQLFQPQSNILHSQDNRCQKKKDLESCVYCELLHFGFSILQP